MQSPPLQEIQEDGGPDLTVASPPDNADLEEKPRPRPVPRVSVDYFDPSGVRQLEANLRRISSTGVPGVRDSDVTLAESFDLEKTMRSIFEQFVTLLSPFLSRILSLLFTD